MIRTSTSLCGTSAHSSPWTRAWAQIRRHRKRLTHRLTAHGDGASRPTPGTKRFEQRETSSEPSQSAAPWFDTA
eukprot:576556-Prorocentrum_lima.AAC.1